MKKYPWYKKIVDCVYDLFLVTISIIGIIAAYTFLIAFVILILASPFIAIGLGISVISWSICLFASFC